MSGENKNDGFDIAGDVSSSNVNVNNEQNSKIIEFNVLEEKIYLGFKVFGFIIAMGLAVCFLKTGLEVSKDSLMHIVHHQGQPTKLVEVSKPADESKKENKEIKKEEPESMSNKMLYSGSIITLVAFILGTGLTLLLTIVKFSFHSRQQNEDNPNVALAGPASELFMALANYIKSKIK
ncbi:hypothetical protein [Pseudoalteromonas sp. TB41]|uniref:hypothetical protein n=1 Tax=Pseudoalteromonas sp. TB41 TaxID=985149 RepID=UPI000406BB52|nr:hypothetical protein [Pseudoalteromonas sp. TB41]